MRRHVRGTADFIFMTSHQHAVARADQVRLNEVRALLDGQKVGGQRVLRDIAAGTPVSDDDRHQCTRRHGLPNIGAFGHDSPTIIDSAMAEQATFKSVRLPHE